MGLAQNATTDQVKKRFRELARQYHPDLHRDHPEYHEVFIRISQANDVLSDSVRRAHYDLGLRDQARRQPGTGAAAHGSAPFTQRPTPPPSASSAKAAGGPARPAERPPANARERREAEHRRQQLIKAMENARQNFQRGNFREAQRLCEEVLQTSRNAAAHEMLGDIYARQGRLDEAVSNYTVAAQMLPNNSLIMAKLNRVVERQRRGPAADELLRGRAGQPPVDPQKRVGYQLAVTFFGLAVILFLMAWPVGRGEAGLDLAFAPHWTLSHVVFLGIEGLFAGVVLGAAGWLRPPDQELLYQSFRLGRLNVPMGLLLVALGLVFAPIALAAYVILAFRHASVSRSVLTVFGVAFLLNLAFTFATPHVAQNETLLFGANVIFVASLFGWFIGDLFRPSWAA
jgi:curved DNA-binding protein CbpA